MKKELISTIRMLSAEAIQKANSGHPGLPLGAAPLASELFTEHLRFNPDYPNWENRDRFILSAGHGSMLLYSLLNLFGYDTSIEDIKAFRQLGSKTPGHPERGHTAGVEITTGPLGQGIANGVGFAIAEAHMAERFNKEDLKLVDHYTYVLVGDGCLMEGISYEAASLAGHLGLGKLIVLYDSNDISIEGSTNLTFTENVRARFDSLGWNTLLVEDGEETSLIGRAIETAKSQTEKPTLIEIKTVIGKGVKSLEGTSKVHGAPIGLHGMEELKEYLGREEGFHVSEDLRSWTKAVVSKKQEEYAIWEQIEGQYANKYNADYDAYKKWLSSPTTLDITDITDLKSEATRVTSGKIIQKVFEQFENLMGGSADLGPSNNSEIKASSSFSKSNRLGKNLHFGVREHAMAAIANGLIAHGGIRPFVATFFVFSDYMKPAIRLASLMKLPVIYILTHDSIGVGEDGPTHQPIDQLAMLRAIPNLNVIRPADATETVYAWKSAIESTNTPTAIILSRQNLPLIESASSEALKGGYIIKKETKSPFITLIATGSEVIECIKAAEVLENGEYGVRVVSMPSIEIFEEQNPEYKKSVLSGCKKHIFSVEAGSTFGWSKYAKYNLGIDEFGVSAPAGDLFRHFGLDSEGIIKQINNIFLQFIK